MATAFATQLSRGTDTVRRSLVNTKGQSQWGAPEHTRSLGPAVIPSFTRVLWSCSFSEAAEVALGYVLEGT